MLCFIVYKNTSKHYISQNAFIYFLFQFFSSLFWNKNIETCNTSYILLSFVRVFIHILNHYYLNNSFIKEFSFLFLSYFCFIVFWGIIIAFHLWMMTSLIAFVMVAGHCAIYQTYLNMWKMFKCKKIREHNNNMWHWGIFF